MKLNLTPIFCAIFVAFSVSAAHAGDLVNKKYRAQYLSPEANKNYYRTQVNAMNFFDRQTSGVNGLVESFRGTSVYSYDIFSRAFIYGSGGVLDAQSFTYDGAMAALSYLVCDQPAKAAKILRVYRKEFYCIKNDSYGLFNSYRTDKEATKWGLSVGIDGDRMHVGPTMWVALAATQYTAVTGNLEFLPFILDICKWAEALPHYTLKNGQRGAVSMGFGWGPDWSKVFSTENVVDQYALLKMLLEIYDAKNDNVKGIFEEKKYAPRDIKKEMFAIERWLMEVVYDAGKKTFNTGANENGVDKTDALDAVSWTILALDPVRLTEMGVDPFVMMQFADKNFLVEDNLGDSGFPVKGYDFTNKEGRRKDYRMVWFEGTGFHIAAMQAMSKYSEENGYAKRAPYFRQQAMYFLNEMSKASEKCALIDGSLPYTSKKPKEREIFTTFYYEWEIPRGRKGQWVSSASSTAWRIIAMSAFNPMSFDKKNVNYKLFK